MKKSLIISMLFVLAACSDSQQENKDITAKKVELEKLTKERDALSDKITALEAEIVKLGGTAAPEKIKLVEVTALATQDFAHYIELQGKITTEQVYYVTPLS